MGRAPHPIWQEHRRGLLAVTVMASLLALTANAVEIDIRGLLSNVSNIVELLRGFYPPDFSEGRLYVRNMAITLTIALWGTFIAVVLAVPLSLFGSRNVSATVIRHGARRVMDVCRAINEMVFALLFVVAVGLGPFAGVLALAFHTAGTLAKLFSESVESADPRPAQALRAMGAHPLVEIWNGVLPLVLPLWASFILYRFESNVRAATVLGIVGAGGIGQLLYESLRGFNYQATAAILLIIVVTVTVLDLIPDHLRKALL
jgi:phosphonate transport system permease protein